MLLRWFPFLVTVGLLAAPPPADAVRVRARFPAVVTTGSLVRVPGRVSGGSRVRLEQQVRGRWAPRGGGRRFPLRRRAAPSAGGGGVGRARRSAGLARMRAVALRGGRVAAATAVRPVAVSATRVLSPGRVVTAPMG